MTDEAPAGHTTSLATVCREWTRIGTIGFGGPPSHIKLLRRLCVDDRSWLTATEFEDAVAATNLLPGPASTQLAIYCAWRLRGAAGAVIGGLGFILPGLVAILGLSALFLQHDPPNWLTGAAAGAGAVVPAVAISAALALVPASWRRARDVSQKPLREARWVLYILAAAVAASVIGAYLVAVLLACGGIEYLATRPRQTTQGPLSVLALAPTASGTGGLGAVAWVAIKVGLLAYGGGFVIVPLMQQDAVNRYHWMSSGQFLSAVALGQITPGPVVHTVTAVGYAAHGLTGGLLAATIAFTPSFLFILIGGPRFRSLRTNLGLQAFLAGAGPAAIGGILGSAVPLTRALSQPWQYGFLAVAAIWLVALRRGPVAALVAGGCAGLVISFSALTV